MPKSFWRNLRDGVESIRRLTAEELVALGADPALLEDPRWVPAVAMPEDFDRFDARFFGMSVRDAEILDPQQRIFLETAWAALEDAGCDPEITGDRVGVFAGAGMSVYLMRNLVSQAEARSLDPLQAMIANMPDSLTARVSYKLNLRGPSYSVQSACSTSMVAVHHARLSLLAGECDVALAGAVSLPLSQLTGYAYQEGSIASPDGHCRAFDAGARGTVFGGGAGIVVLKRLEDALADSDTIRAVLLGSAVNNDGSLKVGFTAPSVEGQEAVLREALAAAGVGPEAISYVEAHGTGTEVGDPIEVQALSRALGGAAQGQVALGSIKTNFGHLDTAAGVAGLIKTILALEHRQIPPSLHYQTPNPAIDFVQLAGLRQQRAGGVALGGSAPRRGKQLRDRRHQLARHPGRGAGGRSFAFISALAPAGALGPHGGGARKGDAESRRSPAPPPGARHRGRGLDAPDRAQGFPLPARGGLPRAGRRGHGFGEPRPGAGVDGRRRARAVRGVPAERPGLAVPGHGTGDL